MTSRPLHRRRRPQLRQAPQAIEAVSDAFRLSAGEAAYLLAAPRGEALLCAGPGQRAAFIAVVSPAEHQLITTDPAELVSAPDSNSFAETTTPEGTEEP